jgi:hypothetical protein
MASSHAPQDWKEWSDWLAAGLHGRSSWRLPLLMAGLICGPGPAAAWIRPAELSNDYWDYYYFQQSVGRSWTELRRRVTAMAAS